MRPESYDARIPRLAVNPQTVTADVVRRTCREWLDLGLARDPMGVAMELIDRFAEAEGLVDADGNALDGAIDLAASTWAAMAETAFDEIAAGVS
jgi:hypothetical protein